MSMETTKARILPPERPSTGQAKSDSGGKKTVLVVGAVVGAGVGAEDTAPVGAKVGIGVGAEVGAGLGAWNVVVVVTVVLVALSSKLGPVAPSTNAPLKATSSKTERVRTMVA